jgi:cyclopropane fatty-acyl-phospholipid synthase-like methyltransferase
VNSNHKPFSQACLNNRDPILTQLKPLLEHCQSVLEIGSGTGQHAIHFAQNLPHLQWQTSDLPENHWGIQQWINDEGSANCLAPITIDANTPHWGHKKYDALFTANTLHIMPWDSVILFFKHLGSVLNTDGLLIIYGPFNYQGQYTSESNAHFDQWLKEASPTRGIRDIEAVNQLAEQNGLLWVDDLVMPANNFLQVYKKSS